MDWNLEVNGRRLIDHTSELNNPYRDMKVGGRPIMLHKNEQAQASSNECELKSVGTRVQ